MSRQMNIAKAQDILKAYREHKYKAKPALESVGYSAETARTKSKRTIETAITTIARRSLEDIAERRVPTSALAFSRLTDNEIRTELLKVALQDRDYSNKLKALSPMLRELGIRFDEENKTLNAPTVNIKLGDKSAEYLAKELGGTVGLSELPNKEGERLSPKNAENTLSKQNIDTEKDSYIGESEGFTEVGHEIVKTGDSGGSTREKEDFEGESTIISPEKEGRVDLKVPTGVENNLSNGN